MMTHLLALNSQQNHHTIIKYCMQTRKVVGRFETVKLQQLAGFIFTSTSSDKAKHSSKKQEHWGTGNSDVFIPSFVFDELHHGGKEEHLT